MPPWCVCVRERERERESVCVREVESRRRRKEKASVNSILSFPQLAPKLSSTLVLHKLESINPDTDISQKWKMYSRDLFTTGFKSLLAQHHVSWTGRTKQNEDETKY